MIAEEQAVHTCGTAGGLTAKDTPCGWGTPPGERCKRHPFLPAGTTEEERLVIEADIRHSIAASGAAALKRHNRRAIYISFTSRATVERTLESVARGVAGGLISDKRAAVVVRACAERLRALDLNLAQREALLAEADA